MEHKHFQNKCKPTSVWKFLTILKKLKKVRILRDAFFFCIFELYDSAWRYIDYALGNFGLIYMYSMLL